MFARRRRARASSARHGFRVARAHRQFVLPIALHKAHRVARGSRERVEGALARAGLLRLSARSGRPVDACVAGAVTRPRHRRHRLHRRPPGARARARAATACARSSATPRRARDLARRRHRARPGRPPRSPTSLDRAVARRRRRLQHRRDLPAGGRAGREPTARSTRRRRRARSRPRRAAGVRRVVHCSTVGVHGDVEHPPANEDAPLRPGDVYQETKLEGERVAREAAARDRHRGGHRAADAASTVRATAGCSSCSAASRAALRHPRARRDLLPSDLHRRSRRGLPAVRRRCRRPPAAPTSWPAGK